MVPYIALFLGFSCLWMSFVSRLFMLMIGFFLIRFFGQGSMTLGPSTLVPQWFDTMRGRAFSIMTLGGVAGSAFIPPMNTWLIQQYSWRFGWRFWTVMLWLIMVPLAIKFIRDRPQDMGLLPDGVSMKESTDQEKDKNNNEWTLAEAKKNSVFWFLLYCSFVPAMVNTGLVFHLVSILGEQGLSPSIAAMVLSILAMTALPITFIDGFLLDFFPENLLMAFSFFIHSLALFFLLRVKTVNGAILCGILFGIAFGMESINLHVVWPNYFGRRYLGSIRGFSMKIGVIASAFGPLPFGVAFDYFGRYNEIVYSMLLFPLLAIIISYLATKPKKELAFHSL